MAAPDPNVTSAYRLPTDVAARIRTSASPVAAVDHHRRRAFLARILAVELAGRSRPT